MSVDVPFNGGRAFGTEQIDALVVALPAWLEERRWFADKGRGIVGVELEDALVQAVQGEVLMLTVLQVAFASGEDSRYLVPLARRYSPGGSRAIADAAPGWPAGAFIEATETPWFGSWLIGALLGGTAKSDDNWTFEPNRHAPEVLAAARDVPAAVMRAEQSNTSIRYGDVAMAKLVRRLQPGPNPDEELLRALGEVGFDRVPPYLGGASWRASDGKTYPIALAQAFVPNLGDGWSWMRQRLRELCAGASIVELDPDSPEWLLGRRTGEMHAALSRLTQPGLAPEPSTSEAIAADKQRMRQAVEQTVSLLRQARGILPDSLHASLPTVISRLREAALRADGLSHEADSQRIRVHGDYHLGQTLRTPDEDWVIIDFEGEPARPVAERRQKTSALKDVAGMLRSFAYARGAGEQALIGDPVLLVEWESAARHAFLDGYRDAIRDAPVNLVPAEERAFLAALAAWELDKALYEVAYEVRNRPDWVELPLRSLLAGGLKKSSLPLSRLSGGPEEPRSNTRAATE